MTPPLALVFTETFAALYDGLPMRDVAAVDRMLDELERHHEQPHLRGVIRVGEHSLFVTPRIHAPGGLYRITWCYDDRRQPTAVVCLTVAEIET